MSTTLGVISFRFVRYREFRTDEVSVGIRRKLVWNSSSMKWHAAHVLAREVVGNYRDCSRSSSTIISSVPCRSIRQVDQGRSCTRSVSTSVRKLLPAGSSIVPLIGVREFREPYVSLTWEREVHWGSFGVKEKEG